MLLLDSNETKSLSWHYNQVPLYLIPYAERIKYFLEPHDIIRQAFLYSVSKANIITYIIIFLQFVSLMLQIVEKIKHIWFACILFIVFQFIGVI